MAWNKLTMSEIKFIKKAGDYADGGNLYLRVKNHDGRLLKTWVFCWSRNGKAFEREFGSLETYNLAEARIIATGLRAALRNGGDIDAALSLECAGISEIRLSKEKQTTANSHNQMVSAGNCQEKPDDKMLALFQKLTSLTTQRIIEEAGGPFAIEYSFEKLESEYAKAAYEVLKLCLAQAKEYFVTRMSEKAKAYASIDQGALLRQLHDFIKQHGHSRFNPMFGKSINGQPWQGQEQDCIGYYRDNGNGREYLFTPDGLREATFGFDFQHARRKLAEKNVLIANGKSANKYGAQMIYVNNNNFPSWFYIVSFDALSQALEQTGGAKQ